MSLHYTIYGAHGLLSPVVPRAFLHSLSAQSVVGFAGLRSFSPCPSICLSLLCQLASSRCRFAVGCASGVDRAFTFPLVFHFSGSASFYRAFPELSSLGLPVAWSSSAGLRPAVALATRTRQLVTACSHLVVHAVQRIWNCRVAPRLIPY